MTTAKWERPLGSILVFLCIPPGSWLLCNGTTLPYHDTSGASFQARPLYEQWSLFDHHRGGPCPLFFTCTQPLPLSLCLGNMTYMAHASDWSGDACLFPHACQAAVDSSGSTCTSKLHVQTCKNHKQRRRLRRGAAAAIVLEQMTCLASPSHESSDDSSKTNLDHMGKGTVARSDNRQKRSHAARVFLRMQCLRPIRQQFPRRSVGIMAPLAGPKLPRWRAALSAKRIL
ncbi:hypothetical protein HBI81_205440 [Parastagonospora nodorum]|nr:hypothetical protein HBI10_216310 [Parastagonospora nodorum]KAH4010380.1 hypothetical protein HBI13_207240 [Parastagonospora nodorum]KAH4018869.1 hypothetical protein HBI09_190650 [Parastagonospora nodorum]KAH4043715.1 hypothetical protein HBH49_225420 [Parastagonospora nodorum]KAH4061741.1 hypothetical protein HBH50_219830 [Parastagonospora nodorum]